MSQPLEFFAAAERSKGAEDLKALAERNEFGGRPLDSTDLVTITIFKILTIIAGIFFVLLSATSLDPQLAFLTITMIVVLTGTVVIASRKIVDVFPRTIYRSRAYVPPAYIPSPRASTFSAWLYPSSRPTSPPVCSSSSFRRATPPPSRRADPAWTRSHTSVGGGHDPRNTTPAGNVIPGSGRRR